MQLYKIINNNSKKTFVLLIILNSETLGKWNDFND